MGNDVPLPPNPILEEFARGHGHVTSPDTSKDLNNSKFGE